MQISLKKGNKDNYVIEVMKSFGNIHIFSFWSCCTYGYFYKKDCLGNPLELSILNLQ